MRSSDEHQWKKSDDLVAFYLARHGADKLEVPLSRVARTLGISLGSMKMRISNFQSLEGQGGLKNAANQSRSVFKNYRPSSEADLRMMVLGVLMRARDDA